MLRLSFIAERRKGLRPWRKSRRERGLHLNAGPSVEQPCYEVARWRGRKMQLVGGCWREVGGWIRVTKKSRCRESERHKGCMHSTKKEHSVQYKKRAAPFNTVSAVHITLI